MAFAVLPNIRRKRRNRTLEVLSAASDLLLKASQMAADELEIRHYGWRD